MDYSERVTMNANTVTISATRESLKTFLGIYHEKYLTSLRDWFGQKSTKDDFDMEVLPFLDGEALRLHNQFMTLLLNECESRTSLGSKVCNANSSNVTYSTSRSSQQKKRKLTTISKKTDIERGRLVKILKKVRPPEPKDSRFPDGFVRRFLRSHDRTLSLHPNIILNVTHVPLVLTKHLTRDPKLIKFFSPRKGSDQPLLSCNASVQGKLLYQAWSKGLSSVDSDVVDIVVKACHAQVKRILTSLLKRRKVAKLQAESGEGNGESFTIPELRRGSYIEDLEPKPESEIGGFIRVSPSEDKDRIIALEASCPIPTKSAMLRPKACPADLYEVIQADSSLIPCCKTRHLLKEKLFLLSSGSPHSALDNIGEIEDDQDLLPICSY